ncbi:MAG: tRNA uridine-5-carboxymethylaminomethyl(34) synthesis GTPase MnmE [Candidatus Aminicenantes bacterium]|nr:tRNA uridine-5-carboxymethylaminomethyl(34) synthesis GTPase MnmE [Candidatus Aminicenantes bacterium]
MAFADTIAAVATPPGTGGIGIIRVSGGKSEDIAALLFKSSRPGFALKSHRLHHGQIVSARSGKVLDEVLVTLMKKPQSYTGEDVLEIHCHGNPLILQAVLAEAVHAGARLAEPGEFTKRAFLNGRIDLCRAEAVADIVGARTGRGLEIARAQNRGELSGKIEGFRQSLIGILAELETAIDFTEEEVSGGAPVDARSRIDAILQDLDGLSSTYDRGKLVRKGVSAVITGKPNAGKSSLLNRLLGENRAIVTHIPGTTRDFIEEVIGIRGVPVRLTDTAGIRDPANIIEREGIDRVWERLSSADAVIMVFDGSAPLTAEDEAVIEKNRGRAAVPVINKSDLEQVIDAERLRSRLAGAKPLRISAKTGDGIPALLDAVYDLVTGQPRETDLDTDLIITRVRHKTALEKTAAHLLQARESLAGGLSAEFVAFDIREALDSLGEITGMTSREDILDRIFSTFCVGK